MTDRDSQVIDLSRARIFTRPGATGGEDRLAGLLGEEILRRTGLDLPLAHPVDTEPDDTTCIVLATSPEAPSILRSLDLPEGFGDSPKSAESYSVLTRTFPRAHVLVCGADYRGLLYGIGLLLRRASWTRGELNITGGLEERSSPVYPVRGTELYWGGNYACWEYDDFDRYFREQIFFGCNGIRTGYSPEPIANDPTVGGRETQDRFEGLRQLSRLAESYDMEFRIATWPVGDDGDYDGGKYEKTQLEELRKLARNIPRLTHFYMKGSDPGRLTPPVLFRWTGQVYSALAEFHPGVRMWISSQQQAHPEQEWSDQFMDLANERPGWLDGIVFAQGSKPHPKIVREKLHPDLGIINQPNMTSCHSVKYAPKTTPDLALAITAGRQPPYYVPRRIKTWHDLYAPYGVGTIPHMTGVTPDANKTVCLALGWNPDADPGDVLREYAGVFCGREIAEDAAAGMLALEGVYDVPLLVNPQVDVTARQWTEMAAGAPDHAKSQWRFQMGMFKACYDAYVRRRLIHETGAESRAIALLDRAEETGAHAAIAAAEAALRLPLEDPSARAYRGWCFSLADSLFESIGLMMSGQRHGTRQVGNFEQLDHIDDPVNDSPRLLSRVAAITDIQEEHEKLAAIRAEVNRTNPGPGGYYDHLASPAGRLRVLDPIDPPDDAGMWTNPHIDFASRPSGIEHSHLVTAHVYRGEPLPWAWLEAVCALHGAVLRVEYAGLPRDRDYDLRIAYPSTLFCGGNQTARLDSANGIELHGYINVSEQPFVECVVPREAIVDGRLELIWRYPENKIGVSVAELWLKPRRSETDQRVAEGDLGLLG